MKHLPFLVVIIMFVTGCGGSGGGGSSPAPPSPSAELQSIEITPSVAVIPKGMSQNFTATGYYSDNSIKNISENVQWSVSDETIAEISNTPDSKGSLRSLSVGSGTLTASMDSISSPNINIDITDAVLVEIEITPHNASTPVGTRTQYTATGIYSDSSVADITKEVVWESSAPSVSEPGADPQAPGLFSTYSEGAFTIQAYFDSVQGSVSASVTTASLSEIFITPSTDSIARGLALQLTATGVFSDSTTKNLTNDVLWQTSDTSIATISNIDPESGRLQAASPGIVQMTASFMGLNALSEITVSDAVIENLVISPADNTLAIGTEIKLHAKGTFTDGSHRDLTSEVLWASTSSGIASVNNSEGSQGKIRGIAEGSTEIEVFFQNVSASAHVTVTEAVLESIEIAPHNSEIPTGISRHFIATGNFSDGSTQDLTNNVLWQSSDHAIAFISNFSEAKGKLHTYSAGIVTITATHGDISVETTINVIGESLVSLNISPTVASIMTGSTLLMKLEGVYSDNITRDLTSDAIWVSLNEDIVSISNINGVNSTLTGLQPGNAVIAAVVGNIAMFKQVTVLKAFDSIDIQSDAVSIPVDGSISFHALVNYTDGTSEDITNIVHWESSNKNIATIFYNGNALAIAEGDTTISASVGGTVYGSVLMSVSVITKLGIDAQEVNGGIQFTAIGQSSLGVNYNLTSLVTWKSNNPLLITISNEAESMGFGTIQDNASGTCNITAIFKNIPATFEITIQ